MGDRHFGPILSFLRQGLSVGLEFGTHSLEAMIAVAETVENSIYEHGSLAIVPAGLSFSLLNPPLRMGAFSAIRIFVDAREVPAGRIRLRGGPGQAWHTASEITGVAPWGLRPGDRTDFILDVDGLSPGVAVTIRLELDCVAIPPLVWLEFSEMPRPEAL